MLTTKQAADRAMVSVSLMYQWCQDGVLVHYRFGRPGKHGRIRIEESDLEPFLETCNQAGRPQSAGPLRLKFIRLDCVCAARFVESEVKYD